MKMKGERYLSPVIYVESIKVERGFAASGTVENDYAAEGAAGMLQEGNSYEF